MDFKRFAVFSSKVTAAHVTTYFLAGAVFYQLLTKDFYTGPNPVFAIFMRTEAELELWSHVVRWFLPAQISRGLLIAAVLYPLFDTLQAWSFGKRFLTLASLYLGLGFWGATVAAPGTRGPGLPAPLYHPLCPSCSSARDCAARPGIGTHRRGGDDASAEQGSIVAGLIRRVDFRFLRWENGRHAWLRGKR